MKKVFAGIMALVCVAGVVCFGTIMNIKESYEVKLAEANTEYEERIQNLKNENNEFELRITELEDAIYRIMMNENYNVSIRHDGNVHTFECEYDEYGLFSRVNHNITY